MPPKCCHLGFWICALALTYAAHINSIQATDQKSKAYTWVGRIYKSAISHFKKALCIRISHGPFDSAEALQSKLLTRDISNVASFPHHPRYRKLADADADAEAVLLVDNSKLSSCKPQLTRIARINDRSSVTKPSKGSTGFSNKENFSNESLFIHKEKPSLSLASYLGLDINIFRYQTMKQHSYTLPIPFTLAILAMDHAPHLLDQAAAHFRSKNER